MTDDIEREAETAWHSFPAVGTADLLDMSNEDWWKAGYRARAAEAPRQCLSGGCSRPAIFCRSCAVRAAEQAKPELAVYEEEIVDDLSPPWILFTDDGQPVEIMPAGRPGTVLNVEGWPLERAQALIAAANQESSSFRARFVRAVDKIDLLHERYMANRAQPVKAEQDERERAHLLEGAAILLDCIDDWGIERFSWETRNWLEAERARLSVAVEPRSDAEEGRR